MGVGELDRGNPKEKEAELFAATASLNDDRFSAGPVIELSVLGDGIKLRVT